MYCKTPYRKLDMVVHASNPSTWEAEASLVYKVRAEANTALDMTPFLKVTSQQPGGRLTTLDHFLRGKDSVLFLLE